jgi:hypothetical protein
MRLPELELPGAKHGRLPGEASRRKGILIIPFFSIFA